ncbi:MAG: hypothetical protein WDZ89_04330, partial [Gemmatimonadota bacterium]
MNSRRGRVAGRGRLAILGVMLAAGTACSGDDPATPPFGEVPGERVASVPIPANYGIHDMFVRDGIVFVSAWNTGVIVLDIGGAGGGTPAAPRELSRLAPSGGDVSGRIHNAWWFHNPNTAERRYLFLGQEGPGVIGENASGDLIVFDVSDLSGPVQVARYTLPGAGAHNFWMDEEEELLFAAFYNGGVVALDVSGTLPEDLAEREVDRVRPGGDSTYTWGVQLHRGSLYAADMLSGFHQLRLEAGGLEVVAGGFNVPGRATSDLWLHGDFGYTGTWGNPGGSAPLYIWTLDAGGAPTRADSLVLTNVTTVSDVEVSADGRFLLVSTEGGSGAGIHLFALENPLEPR